MTTRYEQLNEIYAELFEKEREDKLPVWAQIKLNRLRNLVRDQANETDMLRMEIDRLSGSPRD